VAMSNVRVWPTWTRIVSLFTSPLKAIPFNES
jgi:hypothetical protein